MGMFFNSWKDDDAEYYYDTVSEVGSSNYNRGYDDGYEAGKKSSGKSTHYSETPKDYRNGYNEGYEDAKKEFKKSFDSAYNKGFRAGLNLYFQKKEPLKKDALEILMDELEDNRLSIEASKLLEEVDDLCTINLCRTVYCDESKDVIDDALEYTCSEPEPDMSLDTVN